VSTSFTVVKLLERYTLWRAWTTIPLVLENPYLVVGVAMLPQLNSSEVHGEEVRGEEAFVGNRRVG
jgi:hypothetical protein